MARLRLVCFPYAGSGPSAYLGWARHLPAGVELRLVSPPGGERREDEPPETDLGRYVGAVTDELLADRGVPYALFGHSLGAALAYQAALRLQAAHHPPEHVFLSAKETPDDPERPPPLHLLGDDELVLTVRSLYGGLPVELESEPAMMASVLHRLRVDFSLLAQVPAEAVPKLRNPVSVLWSPEDESLTEAQVRRWETRVAGPVHFEAFRGGHLYLARQSAAIVRFVCEQLQLERMAPASPAPGRGGVA